MTFTPRATKTRFVTGPSDVENLFWCYESIDLQSVNGPLVWNQNPVTNRYRLTDDYGFGKLVVGDFIYLQIDGENQELPLQVGFCIDYTYAEVNCKEYVQALAAQLTSY